MTEECVIIGGGVSGLCAANQLANAGLSPLIIESGTFPSHRICGEFLSHECLPILRNWEIPLSNTIDTGLFINKDTQLKFKLPKESGSCSRYILDTALFERAKKKGARAYTETSVKDIKVPKTKSDNFEIILSNGKVLRARHLMIGTGKIPGLSGKQSDLKYYGFKAHFEGLEFNNAVEIQTFDGGYLGISNVDRRMTNIACIVDKQKVDDPETFIETLPFFRNRINSGQMHFPKWLMGQVPEFGIRKNPEWERVFWIGDAAGSIPPVAGDGLAIAVTSGCMAGEYFLKSDAAAFQRDWNKRYRRRFAVAKLLHKIMTSPTLSPLALKMGNIIPFLPTSIWKLTRE